MPIDDKTLSVAEIYEAAEGRNITQVAEEEALRADYMKRFEFDPEVSLWDEAELKRKQEAERLRAMAEKNKKELAPLLRDEQKTRIAMDDFGPMAGIGAGIGGLNIKNMSSAEIQDKILSITPKLNPQRGTISKKYTEQKKRAAVYGPDVASGIRGMTAQPESLNQKPIDRQRAEPSQEDGNRYTKAVKRGAANMLQTVALLHDFGYLGFERGMEAIGGKNIGQPINSGLEPTQNKLFRTMEELKQERYQRSYESNNLVIGADAAAEQAKDDGDNETIAAIRFMMQNGTLGDAGEILAEMVPSLAMGLGAGAVARRSVGAAAERIVAKKAGSIARRAGETVDAARLAKFVAPVGGAIQGATIGATTDFVGSAGAEYSASYNEGKNMGESIDYALRRSLAQAGVSGLGGALLPIQFGNRLYTSVGQSAIQGVAGYASAAAGAAAVGEELAPEEAALNILMGVVTALPETIAVAGGEVVSRNQIVREVESGLIDQALQNKAVQEDEASVKAAYFAGVMGDVVNRLKESKTAGRSEATVREFINSVREENEAVDAVYMDIDSFNQTLDRYNVPLEDIFEMSPEIARQWERVEDIEGTIRIPLDELLSVAYKIDNDPLIKDILNSMRSDPLAPNAREANESLSRTAEEMKTDVKSIMENYEKIRLEQDDLASVQQLIRDDLKALEFGFEQKTGFNEQASTLVAAMYDSLAKKMGIPARDLYNSMPVRIVSNEQQAAQVLGDMGGDAFNQKATEFTEAETGKPISVNYARNKISSKNYPSGMDFGQKLEPAGEFMSIDSAAFNRDAQPDWEYGSILFENPLVLEHKSTDSNGWKKDLSEMFGGKTGKSLTTAIKKAGYDGVITKDKYGYSETVNISGKKVQTDVFNQSKELLAPNGKPSNLNKKQWNQVRTDDFKKWFGDWENDPASASKVLDDNGEPLIVYHGSSRKFDFFDGSKLSENTGNDGHYGAGFYFSIEKAEAETYGSNVYEAFLNIKDPVYNTVDSLSPFDKTFGYQMEFKTINKNWIVDAIKNVDRNAGILAELLSSGFNRDNVWEEFVARGGEYNGKLDLDEVGDIFENIDDSLGYYSQEFILENIGEIPEEQKVYGYDSEPDILDITDRGMAGQWFSKVVKDAGHDGVIAGSEFVAFDPKQIKSATDNNGAFSPDDADIYNQDARGQIQLELRKIYGYRDSHSAPDADGGYSGANIEQAYPDINSRTFAKEYGDGFSYDAKAVKVIREMQKNPDAEITVYRAVPSELKDSSLNFGDWITLTRDYADEHGKARFNNDYAVVSQKVKASDIYTDGNSIHEWGYSPVDSPVYAARQQLTQQLDEINAKLDQAIYKDRISRAAVLGDKAALKNNTAIAKSFVDSKGISPELVYSSIKMPESAIPLIPAVKGLAEKSDIKENQNLLDSAFDALYLDELREKLNSPLKSIRERTQAKIDRFSSSDNDTKFNLIRNKLDEMRSFNDGAIDEGKTREAVLNQAKGYGEEYDAYIDRFLESLGLDYYNQTNRGQIQFRKDKKGAVIIMGKNADFSTFAHEMGHHFLELNMSYARRPDAPEQLKADMETVMKWAGLDSDLGTWNSLTPEQKTEVHEKFAESFEAYMFTGKSPSNALREVFARFRTFMTAVYKNMARFMGINPRADLNPEITAVMDRLVATQDAIEEVQRQRNLEMLITPEMATELGIPFKEYDEMRQDHEAATEAAINELEQKTIKDLAWYRNLRNKHVAAFNSQAKRVRQQMRELAAKEVAEMPVYQAIAYLRQPVEKAPKVVRNPNVVDTAVDSLLEAIAKYGGIDADEIAATWGTDKPESYKVNVGRVKKVARKGGLSIETVAERLAEDGYLQKDQYGQFDTRELEDLFTDSLSGGTYYSMYADFELFHHGDDYGLAMGELPAFPDAAKLNLEWIKAKYGEDSAIYNAIPKNGKYALASLDGFDPEAIASRFGYESADKMIREIVDAPAPKELIEQKSGELMQEGYSDLFDENAVNQAIDEAVHNDIRAQMLAREMAAISKMNGRHAELNAAAKAVAGNIISKSLIRDIRPSVFSATELRLARQYDKALRSGDTVEAARIKRNQLVNFHAAKRAHEVQAQIKSLRELQKKIFGSDERLSKARDFNYVTLARAVMDMVGLSTQGSNYHEQLELIKEYDYVAFTELADMVQGVVAIMKDYRDLTHAEFDVVDTTIRQIWHLSKESQKFTVEGKRVERAAVIEELSKQADTKPVRSRVYKGPGSGNPKFQRTASNFISAIGHLRRAEQFFTWMDGGKSNGVFHKYLFNPIQDALTNYRLAQREMKKEILDIYSQFDKHEGKIDATEIGYTFNSKQDLLHAILHSGNESNKQRLVLGRQWGEQLEDGSIDYSRWDNFVQRMMNEGIVTKKDMDAAQRIWNLFDGYKKEAQKVHKRMNGRYFEELPKQPLNTPYGQYEGGYIPADYDPVESAEADIRSEKSAAESQKEQVNFATTGANFTKSRAQNFSDKLMLDLTRLPMHLDRELRYIHLEEQVRQVGGVLRSREFRKQLEGVAPYIKNILDTWLSAVATQQTYKPTSVAIADKTIETARRNTGIALMSGNFINAFETLTSLPQILVAVSGKEMALSSAKYFANTFSTKSMTEEVRRLSPFMDTRLDQSMNEYRFQLENFVTNPSLLKKGTDFLHKHAYLLQQLIQVPLEVVTWNAAYSEMVAKGMNDADAIHHADGVMRQYLNDMTPEGLSSVERSTPTVRAMLMFFGWFNMVGNTFITNTKLIKENHSGLARYSRYAYMYAMMMALPAILAKAQREIINDTLSEDEDDELWDSDMTNILINSQLEMITGMVPFGRDVAKLAMPKTEQNAFYAGRYSVSPLISMIENLSKTGSKIIDTTDDEKTVDYSQLAKGILQATTFTTGVPVTFVQRPLVYATDVLVDEDIEPENGVDVARGLMAGK